MLRKDRRLYRFAAWAKGALPKRFYYSNAYFEILALNSRYERPDQKEPVRALLRRRLADCLRESLELVPYYRETVKVSAGDIDESNAVDALKEFPYLEKSTVVDHAEAFMNRRFAGKPLTREISGGSSGQGITVWRSKEEIDIEHAFVVSEWGKLGLDWERSRIVRMGSDANKREDEDPFRYWANRLFVSTFHLNDRWMDEIYRAIVAFKPQFIWSYPSNVQILASYLEEGRKPRIPLKAILLSSETLRDHQYELFKRVFGVPVSSLYGLTERTNMAFLCESESGRLYRLVDTYGYSENRRDGDGVDEIVGTSYWNLAMPLIRYRTSDTGTIDGNGVIRKLQGRTQDFIIGWKGKKIPASSVLMPKPAYQYISICQLAQKKAGEVIFRIVPRKNFTETVKAEVLESIRTSYGGFFNVEIEIVDEIEWTKVGKRRIVVNGRAPA
jgi:phenylacetate-CoA ligase